MKEQQKLFLAADELMQIQLTGKRLNPFHENEFGFLVQVNCYTQVDKLYARQVALHLIVGLAKDGSGMTIQIDTANIPNTSPIEIKRVVDIIQTSPAFITLIVKLLNAIEEGPEVHHFYQAGLAKRFFLARLQSGIVKYSINRQGTQLFWLYKNDHLVSRISPFEVDASGGHISFTIQAGIRNGLFMQCYDIECMMHMFNEGDKLGYYFELYLDQDNFHHQILYNELPDRLMRNRHFLKRILQLMTQCKNEQYNEYLQDLILKFKACI
ncbi:MAG: cysteine methyltransferase [Solibacillus sp.]